MWGTHISYFSPFITEYKEFQLKYYILDKCVKMIRAVRKSVFFQYVLFFTDKNIISMSFLWLLLFLILLLFMF